MALEETVAWKRKARGSHGGHCCQCTEPSLLEATSGPRSKVGFPLFEVVIHGVTLTCFGPVGRHGRGPHHPASAQTKYCPLRCQHERLLGERVKELPW